MNENNIHIATEGFKLFEGMRKDNLGYIYRGNFTQNIADKIISLAENNLESRGENNKIKKRVFSIMVECLQNVTRHQVVEDEKILSTERSGIFAIQNKNNAYQITSGNIVQSVAKQSLHEMLDKINSLEKDELKEYYIQILENGHISEKGGAGLGLIEIARKSGNKIFYDFKDVDAASSFFYLHTAITTEAENNDFDVDIENIKYLHQRLNDENILLIYSGTLNQESLINLLAIIEAQAINNVGVKKKLFNIMVEMLQNIVKHGSKLQDELGGNPAVFYIAQKEGSFELSTGNYISNKTVPKLKDKLIHVNSLSQDDLDRFYMERLLNFEIDNHKEAGLGVIDLRLKSGNLISYGFTEVNDEVSFVTMQVKL